MAVGALVCGIISIVISLFGGALWLPGVVLGIVAIILGVQARKLPDNQNMATAGLVCGAIGVGLNVLIVIGCLACAGCGLLAASSF